MKLLIASDIHGAADCCRSLLDAWDREGADRLLLPTRLLSKVLMISLWERYRVGYFCNRRVYSTRKRQQASLLNKNRSTIIHI